MVENSRFLVRETKYSQRRQESCSPMGYEDFRYFFGYNRVPFYFE